MTRISTLGSAAKSLICVLLLALGTVAQAVAGSPLMQNLKTDAFETLDDHGSDDKWLVVMIWAHDCEICEREVSDYQQFHLKHLQDDAIDGIILTVEGQRPNLVLWLSVAIHPAFSLLVPCRVPREVVVHHRVEVVL